MTAGGLFPDFVPVVPEGWERSPDPLLWGLSAASSVFAAHGGHLVGLGGGFGGLIALWEVWGTSGGMSVSAYRSRDEAEALFLENQGLVFYFAQLWPVHGEEGEDYVAALSAAVWEACLSWDPSRAPLGYWVRLSCLKVRDEFWGRAFGMNRWYFRQRKEPTYRVAFSLDRFEPGVAELMAGSYEDRPRLVPEDALGRLLEWAGENLTQKELWVLRLVAAGEVLADHAKEAGVSKQLMNQLWRRAQMKILESGVLAEVGLVEFSPPTDRPQSGVSRPGVCAAVPCENPTQSRFCSNACSARAMRLRDVEHLREMKRRVVLG